MKSTLLFITAICCFSVSSRATVYTISVGDREFTPAKGLAVHVGDTVKWMWVSGAHNIMGTKTPPGAPLLSGKVNGRSPSLIYVPTRPGVYEYQCKYYAPMGMAGSFTVVGGNEQVSAAAEGNIGARKGYSAFAVNSNLVSNSLHLQFHNPTLPVIVTVTDTSGKVIKKTDYPAISEADIDLKDVPNGNYLVHAEQGDRIYKQEFEVKH